MGVEGERVQVGEYSKNPVSAAWNPTFFDEKWVFTQKSERSPSRNVKTRHVASHSITPSLHHSITPSLHHSITPSLHHSITPSLHHSITPSLHHRLRLLPRELEDRLEEPRELLEDLRELEE